MTDRRPEDADPVEHPEQLDRADQICDAYEREWIEGRVPHLPDFLSSVPESERAGLQGELELIEQDYKSRRASLSIDTSQTEEVQETSRGSDEVADQTDGMARYRIAHALPLRGADEDEVIVGDAKDKNANFKKSGSMGKGDSASIGALPVDAIRGYTIVKELHRGGQGVVYQAVQESTKQKVALKLLLQGEFAGAEQRRRFEREIELIGSLHHPHIAKIFDSGVARGQLFFAMQYVRGKRLTNHASDHQLSLNDKLRLFKKVCDAVDHAHQRGVIHRDLKPSNILVDARDNQPYVLDFGLAKIGGANDAKSLHVSLTGQIVGTPAYMSPEQAAGIPGDVDLRSDVYSLGVIAYELLTTKLPNDVSGQTIDVLSAIQQTEPKRLRAINRQIQDEVDTIVMKALSKDRTRRYPTAGALGTDIQRFLDGEAIEAKRDSVLYMAKRILRRYRLAAVISTVFLLVICASLVTSLAFWQRAARDRDMAEAARTGEANARAVADDARDSAESIAKEQERRAYNGYIARAAAAMDDDNAAMMKRMLDSCTNPELRGWEWHYLQSQVDRSRCRLDENPVNAMAYSDDGRWIASGGMDGVVRIWDVDTLQLVRTLGTSGGNIVWSLAFSPDGRKIVVGDLGSPEVGKFPRTTIKVWDTISGSLHEIGNENPVLSVDWSADGQWIASGSADGVVKLWGARDDFASHVVAQYDNTHAFSVCFSPDSANVLAAFDNWLGLWDVTMNRRIWVRQAPTQVVGHAAFSPDGENIVWGTREFHQADAMELWDANTGELRQRIPGHRGSATAASFSPNGKRIVSGGSDNTLRLWNPDNGELLGTFRGHTGTVNCVAFTYPHGNRILSAGEDGIRVWDGEPRPDVIKLDDHKAPVKAIAFSSDGRQLVSASVDSTVRMWDTDTASQIKSWRHEGFVLDVDFSADGRHLASVSYRDKSENERGIKRVKLWSLDSSWPEESDPNRNNYLNSISLPREPIHNESVTFGAGGTKLATHQFRTIQIWDVSSRELIASCSMQYNTEISDVAFSSDGAHLAVCGFLQPGIGLLDGNTSPPTLERTLIDLPNVLPSCVVFDTGDRRIAAGTIDGEIYIVDVATGDHVALIGHAGPVTSVTFNPKGDRLFTGGQDQTVKVWNTHTGEELLTLRGYDAGITSVVVSPDGQTVATASDDNTIQLWRSTSRFEQIPITQ